MKVAIIHNKDLTQVIYRFGLQNREMYSEKTVRLVTEALEKNGHNVQIIDGNMYLIERLQEFMPKVLQGERMGMVFNMAYGIQGESRYTHLPAMLEMLGIPYIGSGPTGHALALDKVITKIVLQQSDIPTPQFWVFSSDNEDMKDVSYPVIAKPKMEAVSFGLTIAHNETELRDAVKHIVTEFQQQALVEQFIRGREFCIGLLGNGDPEAFPVLEVDLGNDPDAIQTKSDKYRHPRGKICPADLPGPIAERMTAYSKTAFTKLGLRDFARTDLRMDDKNNIYVLEINSMASLGRNGSYVAAARAAGYDFNALVNRILEVAAVRYFAANINLPESAPNGVRKREPLPVRLRSFVRTNADRIEKSLAKMVNTNTYMRNVDGVNLLGQIIVKELQQLGFSMHSYPQVEVGNILYFTNSENDNDILFLSHLDTTTPFTKHMSFRSTAYKLFGTGVWDSKGGITLLIAALKALRFVRLLRKAKIGILLTSDNALQGRISNQIVKDVSQHARVVIGLSGSGLDSTVITSRCGAAVYACEMNLENAVSAGDIARANALFNQLLASLVKLSSNNEDVLVTLKDAIIKSNVANRYTHGEATVSVRFSSTEKGEATRRKIEQLVKKTKNGKSRFLISGNIRRPPMEKNQHTDQLFFLIKETCQSLDIRVIEEHRQSSADICFVDPGIPRIDGIGPIGDAPHSDREYILKHSLMERIIMLAVLIDKLRRRS